MPDIDWKGLVKTVAPWIGTAIGGPLGGLAVEAAASALGLSERTEAGLKAALGGVTHEQLTALKKADQDFALAAQALGFKNIETLEAIAAGDRASARDMQVHTKSIMPATITAAVMGAFVSTLILLFIRDVPSSNRDIVVYMIGQLSGGFTSALAFWLGTTRESANKTEMLARAKPME